MTTPVPLYWGVEAIFWSAGALACLVAALWLHGRKGRFGAAEQGLVVALVLTAVWAASGAVAGPNSGAVRLAESLRNLAWIFSLYRLFAMDGRLESVRPVRPLLAALTFVEVMQGVSFLALYVQGATIASGMVFRSLASLQLLVAVGGLVLVHNLYAGAGQQARLTIRWPAMALTLLWAIDLNYYAIAYLSGVSPDVIAAIRGLLAVPIAGLLALGAADKSEALRFQPSRAVTFQTVSLLLIGGYLVLMVAVAQWLSFAGSDHAVLLQIAFIAAVSLGGATIWLSSRLRGWLRVTLTKHLFQHRYDYRSEWLRFTRTIGQAGPDSLPLDERVIRAVGDITDSPAGLLLVPGDGRTLQLAARWNWADPEVPGTALDERAIHELEHKGQIIDLDAERGRGVSPFLPQWLVANRNAWALVPLLHFDRLEGVVVLARPSHVRRLDWEDFDLLGVVGRQLASYLAENAGQAALAEAARFDEFHRRIAFVMHDIKNLASQLGLLARNAESHADNPEFRADMLVTLRNSTDKLNALVSRLSRYGPGVIEPVAPVGANAIVRSVMAQLKARHGITLIEHSQCQILANGDKLEQVLLHLVQNAIDVSPPEVPVLLSVGSDRINGLIDVVDCGLGMSVDFVRNRLFRPFDSTKPGGFGIGAYEARELVRAMGGKLKVDTREGLGARFTVVLPLAHQNSQTKAA